MRIRLICILLTMVTAFADDVIVQTKNQFASGGLDLKVVVELVKNSPDAESLEKALNDPDLGINNLDLNNDGYVDYLRVVTKRDGDTNIIILQVPLEANEVQDIATIEIEKDSAGQVLFQVHGDERVYGPNIYLKPVGVSLATFAFVNWLYSPHYRPWVPSFYIGVYPKWYRPWKISAHAVYRPRVTSFVSLKVNFSNKTVVPRAMKIYHPRTTVKVQKKFYRTSTKRKPATVTKQTTVTKKKTVKGKKGRKKTTVTKKKTVKKN